LSTHASSESSCILPIHSVWVTVLWSWVRGGAGIRIAAAPVNGGYAVVPGALDARIVKYLVPTYIGVDLPGTKATIW
jgi:hypothetical protein